MHKNMLLKRKNFIVIMHIDDWELLQNLILQVLVKNVILDNYKVVFFLGGGDSKHKAHRSN